MQSGKQLRNFWTILIQGGYLLTQGNQLWLPLAAQTRSSIGCQHLSGRFLSCLSCACLSSLRLRAFKAIGRWEERGPSDYLETSNSPGTCSAFSPEWSHPQDGSTKQQPWKNQTCNKYAKGRVRIQGSVRCSFETAFDGITTLHKDQGR